MTVYVDEVREYPGEIMDAATRRNGLRWCHMTADTLAELHEMALYLFGHNRYFQDGRFPHYDLTPPKRNRAVMHGARETTIRETVNRMSGPKVPND